MGPSQQRSRQRVAELFPRTLPPWAAQGLAWIVVLLFALAVLAAFVVQVPQTVRGPFVLARDTRPTNSALAEVTSPNEALYASLSLPEEAIATVAPGMNVHLVLYAFPASRHGAVAAVVDRVLWVGDSPGEASPVLARARLTSESPKVSGLVLRAGMRGEARVVVTQVPLWRLLSGVVSD